MISDLPILFLLLAIIVVSGGIYENTKKIIDLLKQINEKNKKI